MKLPALAIFLTAMLSLVAHAANDGLTSELNVWSVGKQADGSEALHPAQSVKPGDLLQYTATYKNAGNRAVSRLVASLPIPAGTEFVGASALPREVQASLDGKVYAAPPLMRKVRLSDGKLADLPVPLTEYRYLRWPEQQVAAGASFSTSARVRVVSAFEPASVPALATTNPAAAAAVAAAR